MTMNLFSRLLLLGGGCCFLCSNLLVADMMTIAGSASGSFTESLPDVVFTGTSFSGSLDDSIILGTFALQRPGSNAPDNYNGRTFSLKLNFTGPGMSELMLPGILSGSVTQKGVGNRLSIDFPDTPTQLGFCISGQGCGSLYLTVNDLDDLHPGSFGDPNLYDLTGTVSYGEVGIVPTPEPASLILLGTVGVLCFNFRKKLIG